MVFYLTLKYNIVAASVKDNPKPKPKNKEDKK
jgi:hypothetical protein